MATLEFKGYRIKGIDTNRLPKLRNNQKPYTVYLPLKPICADTEPEIKEFWGRCFNELVKPWTNFKMFDGEREVLSLLPRLRHVHDGDCGEIHARKTNLYAIKHSWKRMNDFVAEANARTVGLVEGSQYPWR